MGFGNIFSTFIEDLVGPIVGPKQESGPLTLSHYFWRTAEEIVDTHLQAPTKYVRMMREEKVAEDILMQARRRHASGSDLSSIEEELIKGCDAMRDFYDLPVAPNVVYQDGDFRRINQDIQRGNLRVDL